jgi:hypothetical protein
MQIKKLLTIIGIAIIFISLGIGGYFVFQKGLISFKPDPSIIPSNIKITNIAHDRFTVSWKTTGVTNGSIMHGINSKMEQIQLDDSDQLTGQSKPRKIHHVTITNLKAASTYYFKIRSGEKNTSFDNEGKPYTVKTASTLGTPPPTDMINGTVLLANGKPALDAVVYVTIPGVIPLSTQVKKDGSWLVSLSNARNAQLTDYAVIDPEKTLIEIMVDGEGQLSKVTTNSKNKSPVPQITLGETYDFTKEDLAAKPDAEVKPKDSKQAIPFEQFPMQPDEEGTKSAEIPETYVQQGADETFFDDENEVVVTSPSENEEIYTINPEFLGTGPKNTVLTILIEGDETISGSTTVDSMGEWSFESSDSLTPGQEYTIQIDYRNQGESKQISQSFTIASSATGGTMPAFEGSSSASRATPSPTPTVTASSSATTKGGVRTSMPSTGSGIPTSGGPLPTFALLMLGIGLMISGYGFKKYLR